MKLPSLSLQAVPRSWLVMGAALFVGLLAALAARHFLSEQIQSINKRDKGREVEQVVAKVALSKGSPITGETVAVRLVPEEYAHETALTPVDFERFSGSLLAFPVRAGETIVQGMLEAQRAPTFSARVAQGRRAITFPVDEINSISGMLEPGDQIDLLLSLDTNGRTRNLPIVQRLSVMATGQRVVEDAGSEERRQYSTVTVDTSFEEANIIIAARGKGKLTALLRNPKDQEPITSNKAEILAALGLAPRPAAGPSRRAVAKIDPGIPVIYGNRATSPGMQDALNLTPSVMAAMGLSVEQNPNLAAGLVPSNLAAPLPATIAAPKP
jgi:pilus assembly protein CpaB